MIKVAFFDAKAYDKPSFEQYSSLRGLQLKYLETRLGDLDKARITNLASRYARLARYYSKGSLLLDSLSQAVSKNKCD